MCRHEPMSSMRGAGPGAAVSVRLRLSSFRLATCHGFPTLCKTRDIQQKRGSNHLLFCFGIVDHHVPRLRPLSLAAKGSSWLTRFLKGGLEVPNMTSSVWQLHQSFHGGHEAELPI